MYYSFLFYEYLSISDHIVTFDGINKIININYGVTDIDVKEDIYSAWKEWTLILDNSKYEEAMKSIGGESIPGNRFVGSTFFLINGWRIRTWEGDHTLTVNGNLFTDTGDNVFITTLDPHNIIINAFQSTLVDGVLGLTDAQSAYLFGIPQETLTEEEHNQLMSLFNIDLLTFVDAVWDKEVAPGITAAEYIVKKLLTTNKYIGLS